MEDFCFCGSGKRKNRCHPYITPDSIVGSMIKLYSSWDIYSHEEKMSHKIKFICEQKCNHCCNNYFYISEKEYLTIYTHINAEFGRSYVSKIIDKAKKYMGYLEKNYPQEFSKINTIIPKNYEGSIASLFQDDIKNEQVYPCIFLNTQTGLCDVYPVRPIVCRLHGVATPFSACTKILRMPNSHQRMVNLYNFPNKDELYQISFLSASKRIPVIFRRSYPIADWFATVLPQQLLTNDEYLICSSQKSETEYHEAAFRRYNAR